MIRQKFVVLDELAEFIFSVGKENIISILPSRYEYVQKGRITKNETRAELIGDAVITKYIVVYDV